MRVSLERDSLGEARVADASYRLVFTVPPGYDRRNYHLIPAECSAPSGAEGMRKGFWNNAKRVFDRHNIRVPLDTLAIAHYNQQ